MWSGRWSTGTGVSARHQSVTPEAAWGSAEESAAPQWKGQVVLTEATGQSGQQWGRQLDVCLLGTPGVAHSGTHDECSLERLNPQVITPSWVRPPLHKEWGRRQGLLFHGYRVLVFWSGRGGRDGGWSRVHLFMKAFTNERFAQHGKMANFMLRKKKEERNL